ncbi:MAG: aspartate aminotransferase family protein [Verrucomicrobiae bacterium]|nr:aspartate aminotransferase family protein [Verrucomicrobiae bacterium]
MKIAHVNGPLPGPKSKQLLDRWHRYEADVVGFQAPVVWDSAKGCVVTDVDGNTFLDWTCGVLVTNVGHCHPHLVAETQKAAARLLNNYECANVERIAAAERLVKALPKHLDRCFFLSTGSEATEAASRLMKRKSGKYEILCFGGGFHGRTCASASMGGLPSPKKGYGPPVPGMIRVPYPNPYRDPNGWCEGGPDFKKYFDFLEYTVAINSAGNLAGVIVEPYEGAAGFIFPPKGWLKKLEQWAHGRGLLLTVDEVQASYGRTGHMWAIEHENIQADILTIGKAIGCGIPVSAVAARAEVFACLSKGEMSSTLGGNPVSSAAVCAVLDIYEKENLVANSAKMGVYMKKRLAEMAKKCKHLGDVRGMGLIMGMEFVKDKKTKEPAPELIKPLIVDCANHGLLIGSVGMYGNVIRVAPPLTITQAEVDESLDIMEGALKRLGSQKFSV